MRRAQAAERLASAEQEVRGQATGWILLLLAVFGCQNVWAGGLSGTVEDEGVSVLVRDVLQLPATAGSPPLARLGILREAPDSSGRLFVNDLRGPLYVIRDDVVSTYLDMSVLVPNLDIGNLQLGLVSFAFHPDFATNGLFYTAHTESLDGTVPNLVPALPADIIHHAVVTEWAADDPAADTFSGSPRELMRIAAPHPTHNLGEVAFDPAQAPGDPDYGLLYIAAGDFGSVQRNDPDQVQRLDTVYGAILRIDPLGTPFQRGGVDFDYGIPPSNPFANDNDPDTFGEIYAYGFRNPQNFHFDRDRPGVLYVAEIGQGNLEEVDIPAPGSNNGWPEREGTYALDVTVNRERVFPLPADDASFGFSYPAAQYDHDEGIAIAGGLAVRGGPPSRLTGRFVFGDISTGRMFYSDLDEMLGSNPLDPADTATVFQLHLRRDGAETTLVEVIRDALGNSSVNRADLRFSTDAAGRLLVTTKQDGYVRELVPLPDLDGLHLYAPTGELSTGVDTCYALLAHLGGAGTVSSVDGLVGSTPGSERCRYEAGVPQGVDFALTAGRAYFVAQQQPFELPLEPPVSCPATDLVPGATLIGVGQPRQGLSCYDLLAAFGPGVVSAVEMLDKNRDLFVSCSTDDGVEVSGVNFPIRPSEGYIVHSRGSASVNLNNLAHAVCQ